MAGEQLSICSGPCGQGVAALGKAQFIQVMHDKVDPLGHLRVVARSGGTEAVLTIAIYSVDLCMQQNLIVLT